LTILILPPYVSALARRSSDADGRKTNQRRCGHWGNRSDAIWMVVTNRKNVYLEESTIVKKYCSDDDLFCIALYINGLLN